mmetsp:Transcript_7269/g.12661  ORF Transcript_7269/g.12661 Transcript_7269/m.12661 type:complete len:214 (-) Transcript_7269:734-1375(-)
MIQTSSTCPFLLYLPNSSKVCIPPTISASCSSTKPARFSCPCSTFCIIPLWLSRGSIFMRKVSSCWQLKRKFCGESGRSSALLSSGPGLCTLFPSCPICRLWSHTFWCRTGLRSFCTYRSLCRTLRCPRKSLVGMGSPSALTKYGQPWMWTVPYGWIGSTEGSSFRWNITCSLVSPAATSVRSCPSLRIFAVSTIYPTIPTDLLKGTTWFWEA